MIMTVRIARDAVVEAVTISSSMFSVKAGVVFLEQLERTYQSIKQTPTIGSLLDAFAGTTFERLRVCTVKKFRNYLVFYSVHEQEILIERILDGRRDFLDQFTIE